MMAARRAGGEAEGARRRLEYDCMADVSGPGWRGFGPTSTAAATCQCAAAKLPPIRCGGACECGHQSLKILIKMSIPAIASCGLAIGPA